jgi:putative nucleotidyltransferase with HDIG domain
MAIAAKTDATILAELEELVRETYTLWDEEWVGFSWRNYTFDHVQRVRRLAVALARREGGNTRVLEFAALLHDITKSYDGEIIMRDGKRVLDENGCWLNETLLPARSNRITELYDRLDLAGTVHSISGARIAVHLLAEYGFEQSFLDHVAEIIHSHLKVTERSSLEGRCIYDADTIDANIGLPAFYRNIQITMHRMEQQFAREGRDLDAYLHEHLREYLAGYLGERIPAWNEGKRNDFVPRLTTEAGRACALARVEHLAAEVRAMQAELDDFDRAVEHGRLAVVRYFMLNRRNPLLAAQMHYLTEEWAPAHADAGARELLARLQAECAGEC